ncbi:hypothetical protein GDO81_016117 [Engystomops pustulosus]|uniref:Uncharacterized protein n=1 Tax=Engystomops pustulosus TaxID=76066 RepID=A0AAV7AQL9_ENGPU|nr:hypothetical protein GDO81_016117 [Engystomops pustulosus]
MGSLLGGFYCTGTSGVPPITNLVKTKLENLNCASFFLTPAVCPACKLLAHVWYCRTRDNPQNDFWGVCLKWHGLGTVYEALK